MTEVRPLILVVDDESMIRRLVLANLERAGYDVMSAADGIRALEVYAKAPVKPNLVILDVMMPEMDGFECARRLREKKDVPVIFMTAKTDSASKLRGFDLGADDYVCKPFSMEEVMIRLHRLVQRSGVAAIDDAELVVGDLVLNQDTREVTRGGEQINLTATQFDLLRYLMENAKRVVSKSQILDNVWNYDFGGQANIVELYISYLRKKIDVGREPMIHTVRGAGYVLRPAV